MGAAAMDGLGVAAAMEHRWKDLEGSHAYRLCVPECGSQSYPHGSSRGDGSPSSRAAGTCVPPQAIAVVCEEFLGVNHLKYTQKNILHCIQFGTTIRYGPIMYCGMATDQSLTRGIA